MPKFSGEVQECDGEKNLVVDGLQLKIAKTKSALLRMLKDGDIQVGVPVEGSYYENHWEGRTYYMVQDMNILDYSKSAGNLPTQASEQNESVTTVAGLFRNACIKTLEAYLRETEGVTDPKKSNVQAFFKDSSTVAKEVINSCTEFTSQVVNRERELEELFSEPPQNNDDEPPF